MYCLTNPKETFMLSRRQFVKWCKDIGVQQRFGSNEVERIFFMVNMPVVNGKTSTEPVEGMLDTVLTLEEFVEAIVRVGILTYGGSTETMVTHQVECILREGVIPHAGLSWDPVKVPDREVFLPFYEGCHLGMVIRVFSVGSCE
jgi:hypothetical protein